jgi:hypothetical protein
VTERQPRLVRGGRRARCGDRAPVSRPDTVDPGPAPLKTRWLVNFASLIAVVIVALNVKLLVDFPLG